MVPIIMSKMKQLPVKNLLSSWASIGNVTTASGLLKELGRLRFSYIRNDINHMATYV